ncbi:MAG TPA: pyrroloquinoline quinone-dependent dehydrogenase [Pedomonas sp.]|uniref:pyrroloquinoline quinone-dependent dehydrogenase n=1 Tax=Pedomonas sp. TaxID=2976421 RepID=UPI002F3F3DB1
MKKLLRTSLSLALLTGVGFAAISLATLPRPEPLYGDPDRTLSGAGNVIATGSNPDEWPSFGRDIGGSQWSPLDSVNVQNVAALREVWRYDGKDFIAAKGFAGTRLEATPLMVDGTLYTCTSFDRVLALDPASGAVRWAYDPHAIHADGAAVLPGERRTRHCRGVAYWRDTRASAGQMCATRVYRSSGDAAVVAIDGRTGQPCRDFGAEQGHPGYVTHKDFENHGEGIRTASSPPLVIGDVIVAAANAIDGTMDAADGMVRGFDARTGVLLWEFNPIPEDKRRVTGAANVWTLLSGDPERKLVFLATTSPSTDFYGGKRQFDIPLSNAVVAVSTETGKVVWHYQILKHDLWDYDLPGHPLAVTIRKDGRQRDVLIQQTKMGTLFVLDRDTGEPVFPVEEKPTPASDISGERAAPFQKTPVLPETFARTRLTRDDMFGLTPFDRAWCRARFDELRYEGIFTPPSEQGSLIFPSALGGGNWGGAAYDPHNNLLIIKAENLATIVTMKPAQSADGPKDADYLTRPLEGTGFETSGELFLSPLGIPCTPPPWGTLTAIDMDSGKRVWQVPLGQPHRFGMTAPAFLNWGSPNVAGPVATAGGLVIVGATLDKRIRAYNVKTGRELWASTLPVPGMAVPLTYAHNGRQYVVIAAGGNSLAETDIADSIVAFALPQE